MIARTYEMEIEKVGRGKCKVQGAQVEDGEVRLRVMV